MRKVFVFLSIFFAFTLECFGASFNMPTYQTSILSVKDGYAEIPNSPNIIVGSSGVVMHTFGNGESSIIARAVVTQKSSTIAKIRFEVFSMLEQSALPLPGVTPKSGDKVILNFLYQRSLIVAPNKEIYAEIVKSFPNITFVHPDIAAADLSYEYKPNPSRDDFRRICKNNAAGLIFIALDGKGVFADCGSFKILKEFPSGKISYYELPFYTQIKNIKTAFWDFKNGQINDYNEHYKHLLGEDDNSK